MNTLLLSSVLVTITWAVRVPVDWHAHQNQGHASVDADAVHFTTGRPEVVRNGYYNRAGPSGSSDWTPMVKYEQNKTPPKEIYVPRQNKNVIYGKPYQKVREYLKKNYRDDSLHEPNLQRDPHYPKIERNPIREESNRNAIHEFPREVPTRPIYPGEGKWATQGLSHPVPRPKISHAQYYPKEKDMKPEGYDVFEDLEKYFHQQKENFGGKLEEFPQKNGFGSIFGENVVQTTTTKKPEVVSEIKPVIINRDLTKIRPVVTEYNQKNKKSDVVYDPFEESSSKNEETKNTNNDEEEENDDDDEEEEEEEEEEESFVPTKLYTQVRKSEDEEHFPSDYVENGRLKEVIKDSKIQTVYTEEGYEDSAYDHEGHEKNAENDEGQAHIEKNEKKDPQNLPGDSDKQYSAKVIIKSEEESSKPKEEEAISDSESSATKYDEEKPVQMKQKSLASTKEVKTTAIKENEDGRMEMEIQSEVKVIVQPNNSTKAHKFVKIYPKVYKEVESEEIPISQNEENEEKTGHSSKTKTEQTEKEGATGKVDSSKIEPIKEEIVENPKESSKNNLKKPSGEEKEGSKVYSSKIKRTLSHEKEDTGENTNDSSKTDTTTPRLNETELNSKTTSIFQNPSLVSSKNEEITSISPNTPLVSSKIVEPLAKITKAFEEIGRNRRKRFTPDLPNVDVDTEFIDKIKHDFKKPQKNNKYPYYKMKNIPEDSPLRYAEDMENVPVKIEGKLSYYEDMERKYECPEVEQEVDSIPNRLKNEDKKEENSQEKMPRLKQLGDKIDCLKARYFGEDPFDSPIFKEELVGPVQNIFQEIFQVGSEKWVNLMKEIRPKQSKTKPVHEQVKKQEEEHNSKEENDVASNSNDTKDRIIKYLNEKKRIMDKERYLQFINNLKERIDANKRTTTEVSIEESEEPTAEGSINTNSHDTNVLNTKSKKDDLQVEINNNGDPYSSSSIEENSTELPVVSLITTPKYTIDLKPKHIYDQIKLLHYLPEDEEEDENNETQNKNAQDRNDQDSRQPRILVQTEEPLPNSEELRRRRKQKRPLRRRRISTTSSPILIQTTTGTPKEKIISEVFYKDQIKPNEQLNVFADILNNIKNSSNVQNEHDKSIEIEETTVDIIGLVPPLDEGYKTIVSPVLDSVPSSSAPVLSTKPKETFVKKFYVLGMKPPPPQPPISYSEFEVKKNRSRRSPNRPSYAELSRRPEETVEEDEEDDDYVPHRPKNYHYDENTGRIVYDKKPQEEEDCNEEDEEEEIEEPKATYKPETKVTTKPLLATATPPPEGKGLLDFVAKLKNNPNYKFIPDPTTTEKGRTLPTTTTPKAVTSSTTPPEFLSILAKVRSQDNYKFIEDPKEKKTKTTTTTETIEEEEEEEEVNESQLESTNNSPSNLHVFDISDFLPKVNSYTPKTTIDYSKYKTIQRPSIRHESNEEDDEKEEEEKKIHTPVRQDELSSSSSHRTTTTTTEETTTTTPRTRLRGRNRFTTQKPEDKEEPQETPKHEKARRTYRRRPTRIRLTTEKSSVEEERIGRRSERETDFEERTNEEVPCSGDEETVSKTSRKIRSSVDNKNKNEDIKDVNVEIVKKYDKTKKHGGNYKKEVKKEEEMDETRNETNEKYKEENEETTTKVVEEKMKKEDMKDVEIIKKFDPTQKHGGNYRREEEEDTEKEETVSRTVNPKLTKNFKKHDDDNRQIKDKIDNTEESDKRRTKIQLKKVDNGSKRLVDVVPKPQQYYTDPNLPKQVNRLKEDSAKINVEDVEEINEEEDDDGDKYDYNEGETFENTENSSNKFKNHENEEKEEATKKPIYIKDPSKRLYYYAPV